MESTRVLPNIGRQVKWSASGELDDVTLTVDWYDLGVIIANSLEHKFVFGVKLTFVPGVGSPTKALNVTVSTAQYCPIGVESVDVFGTPRTITIPKGTSRQLNVNKADITWDAAVDGMRTAAPPVVRISAGITAGRGDRVLYTLVVAQSPAHRQF